MEKGDREMVFLTAEVAAKLTKRCGRQFVEQVLDPFSGIEVVAVIMNADAEFSRMVQ